MEHLLPTLPAGNLHGKRYFRLTQLIGQTAVTAQEAAANRARGVGPKRARPAVPAIVPVSSPTWWRWCATGKAPPPIKLSARVTAWEEGAVLAFLETLASDDSKAVPPAAHGPATKALPAAPRVDRSGELVRDVPTALLLAELERRTAPTGTPATTAKMKEKGRRAATPAPTATAAE